MNNILNRLPRLGLALLILAALLAACAPLAPDDAPPAPTELPTARPTTVEVDPTQGPRPTSRPAPTARSTVTPAPSGDCPASFDALDAVDRALFADIASINDVFLNRRFAIWDDEYRFDDIRILLVRRDKAGDTPRYGFLFNWSSGALENVGSFATPSQLDLGTVYCQSPLVNAQNLATAASLLRQPLHGDLGGVITITTPNGHPTTDDSAFALVYGDRSHEPRAADRAADPRATERWTSDAVRATFGRWQAVEGNLDDLFHLASGADDAQAEPLTKEQVALALLEQRMLAAALRTSGADEQLLRQLVATRQLRLARYPQATQVEQAREQRDGTAEYAAYRFATAAGHTQLQSLSEQLLASYAGDAAPADTAALIDSYLRAERPAITGSAIGLLMDAAAIAWRPQMAASATPFDALAATLPVADADRDALVQQAKERFRYAELEARATAALAQVGGR